MIRLIIPLLLLIVGLPGLETTKPQGPERLADVAAQIASQARLPADAVPVRVIAASVCWRMAPAGEGRWRLERDDFLGRLLTSLGVYQAVDQVIAETAMPEEHRTVLRTEFARMTLWPIRYRVAEMPVKHWCALVASIPTGCTLVDVRAGKSLAEVLAGIDAGWPKRSPLARKAVLDRLAAINPRLRPDGGFLTEAATAHDGVAPGEDVDPLTSGMYGQLIELMPEADLMPVAGQQYEHLVIPAGKGKAWICRYRLSPSKLLIPDAAGLAAWANPPMLDLRNLPIVDTALLKGMTPVELDLGGCQVVDLEGLAGMKSLKVLRLDGCPVKDLSALKGIDLTRLDLRDTLVARLDPVGGAPLAHLDLRHCPATDLNALSMCPLEVLLLTEDGNYEGIGMIANLATLKKTISGIPADVWLKENATKRADGRWDDPGDTAKFSAPGAGPKASGDCE